MALEIVKLYVELNKPQTGIELEKEFHKSLQGTITVMLLVDAKDGRSFKKPSEQIRLSNGEIYCVSNQWGKDNIKRIIARAKDLMSNINIEANS